MIQLHNGELSYNPTHVIYHGVKYKAPLNIDFIEAARNCLLDILRDRKRIIIS